MMLKLFFKGFKKGMQDFSHNLALIINSLLLTIAYLIGIGIPSLFAKIFGKHFIDLKPEKTESYWEELNLEKKKLEEYYRQF